MPLVDKACIFVFRASGNCTEFLAFKHPVAGNQVVKGTIEDGESPEAAACRELKEESGIIYFGRLKPLGSSCEICPGQKWHFFAARADDLRDAWRFQTQDGGGLTFEFFWQEIHAPLQGNWHFSFVNAVEFVRGAAGRELLGR